MNSRQQAAFTPLGRADAGPVLPTEHKSFIFERCQRRINGRIGKTHGGCDVAGRHGPKPF